MEWRQNMLLKDAIKGLWEETIQHEIASVLLNRWVPLQLWYTACNSIVAESAYEPFFNQKKLSEGHFSTCLSMQTQRRPITPIVGWTRSRKGHMVGEVGVRWRWRWGSGDVRQGEMQVIAEFSFRDCEMWCDDCFHPMFCHSWRSKKRFEYDLGVIILVPET